MIMKATSQRKRLSNTTWTLNDKPCKTLKMTAGCWVDQPKQTANGKVGKQKSSLFAYAKRV
jgi:hypothetical protein